MRDDVVNLEPASYHVADGARIGGLTEHGLAQEPPPRRAVPAPRGVVGAGLLGLERVLTTAGGAGELAATREGAEMRGAFRHG